MLFSSQQRFRRPSRTKNMKKIFVFILLIFKTSFSCSATQPPPDPDPIFKFNWIELESDPIPLCSNISFRQCIGISRERCNAVARAQIRTINKEISDITAGKNLSKNELADYRQYIVGQFLNRLRLKLTNITTSEFMRCFSH
jgi:hypothetical protein